MEKGLRKQVEEGIIEPVTQDMGPTPWVANLVIFPKDKGVRLGRKERGDLMPQMIMSIEITFRRTKKPEKDQSTSSQTD